MEVHVVRLVCPNCGAALTVDASVRRSVSCGYCGVTSELSGSGGTTALHQVERSIVEIRTGTDRAVNELTLIRVRGEIGALESRRSELAKLKLGLVSTISSMRAVGCVTVGCAGALSAVLLMLMFSSALWGCLLAFAFAFGIRSFLESYYHELRTSSEDRLQSVESELAAAESGIATRKDRLAALATLVDG